VAAALTGHCDGPRGESEVAYSRHGIAPLVAGECAAARRLIQLIHAGANLDSDLVQQLIDEVDEQVLQRGIDRLAIVRAIGDVLLARATTPICTLPLRRYLNGALLNPRSASVNRNRVLIVDFDFFTAVGGGQTFYRRLIERHPAIDFFYPSQDPDIIRLARGELPPNANPFSFNPEMDIGYLRGSGQVPYWVDSHHAMRLTGVAAAVQGMHFHTVEIPSFFAAAHTARVLLSAWGVTAEKIVVGMMGWLSESIRKSYEAVPDIAAAVEAIEAACVDAADIRSAISELEVSENARSALPIMTIGFEDALESFAPPEPSPPGSGPPDIWYVGRLDGAKGPDLFIEMVAALPAHLYGRCFLAGPDNTWSEHSRWSQHLLNLAAARGLDVRYEGVLSDEEIRGRVYRGRTVVVVPSRVDAFNYVALEAILSGCPILLSDRTGAHRFLAEKYPHLLPATMSPDDLEAAGQGLLQLVSNYQVVAERCRSVLLTQPFPKPHLGFMDTVYGAASVRSPEAEQRIARETLEACRQLPLVRPGGVTWRPVRPSPLWPRVSVIIPTYNRPHFLGPTLASLLRQTFSGVEVVVVDDGSKDSEQIRSVTEAFRPMARYVRIENRGEPAAANCGVEVALGEFIAFLSDDDAYAPELLAESVRLLDANPDAIGCYPDWDIINTSGYFVEAHRLPEFDRRLMLRAHWCLPGPGAVIRRTVVRDIGGKDPRFRQVADFDLWLRATRFGRMIHLPLKLAYWRLHPANETSSDQGIERAAERVALIEKFLSDPVEQAWCQADRNRALAAAHLAAAVIAGRGNRDAALHHLALAVDLDAALLHNLPPNMAGYPAVWPEGYEHALGIARQPVAHI
jgi:glycosyltransferase involved in cell wall biosynthesis/GT2 family glycosyltransferase